MTTENSNDAMLVSRCQKGDRAALDTLIRAHEVRAYQFAYKLAGNADEAADVVSEAFIRVFRAVDRFKGDSAFTTWLYRILTNCFLDMRKKAGRSLAASLDTPLPGENMLPFRQLTSLDRSPYELAESNARAERIDCAMQLIPDGHRDVLTLVQSGKFSYDEIAAKLAVPMGTIKSRIFVARKAIRKLLIDEPELFEMI